MAYDLDRDRKESAYRLNCLLPGDLGDRLSSYASATGVTKVSIVTAALDSYLTVQNAARQMVDRLSDPMVLASVVSSLSPELRSELGLSAADLLAAEESAEG